MSDDPLDRRLTALRRGMVVYAAFIIALIVSTAVSGEPGLAGVVAMFGTALGVTVSDAVTSRIKLERYRRVFGELPGDGDRPP